MQMSSRWGFELDAQEKMRLRRLMRREGRQRWLLWRAGDRNARAVVRDSVCPLWIHRHAVVSRDRAVARGIERGRNATRRRKQRNQCSTRQCGPHRRVPLFSPQRVLSLRTRRSVLIVSIAICSLPPIVFPSTSVPVPRSPPRSSCVARVWCRRIVSSYKLEINRTAL